MRLSARLCLRFRKINVFTKALRRTVFWRIAAFVTIKGAPRGCVYAI